MNWQHCNRMIFVGLSDSYEMFYQAVRRCWRFGQTKPVDVYIIISEEEGAVKANIDRKEADARVMVSEMTKYARESVEGTLRAVRHNRDEYNPTVDMILPEWMVTAA
jgi:predicted HNH restriction endonuclease